MTKLLRATDRFTLGPIEDQETRSLLFAGRTVRNEQAGAIEAQFERPEGGFLLVLSWDTPFEETPWLLLLDADGRLQDRHKFASLLGVAAGIVGEVRPLDDGSLSIVVGEERWIVSVGRRGLSRRPRLDVMRR